MTNPSSNLNDSFRPSSGRDAWALASPAFERRDVEEAFEDDEEAVRDVIPEQQRSGCWYGFTRGVRGLWSTRQMEKLAGDREWYIRTTLRELIIYLVFLIILCVLTFGMMSPAMFYQTKVISELFLDSTFEDSTSSMKTSSQINDFWRFVDNVMLDNLYWENWYNKKEAIKDDRNILYENRLLGSPRLRQLRVRNDSCNVHDNFKAVISQCYDVYSPHIEDNRPFGLMNGTAWAYHSEKEMNGSSHWGLIATYSGAGSYMDIGITKKTAKEKMDLLRQHLWVSRATRAIFLDFTVYNANLNLFCVVKLVFEFPATGGMIPSWSFRTVKLLRYVSTADYFILGCEVLFCFFIIYYIVEELLEIKKNKLSYFKEVWNILDVVVILMSIICIAFSVYRTVMVENLLSGLLVDPELYPDFESLGFWQTQFNNAVALAVFFAWIKFFKYISFNKTMTQLSSTLSRCSKDVGGFAIMFFIVFFAFAQLGYLLFGSQVQAFSSFGTAVFSLLRLILGDFDFEELEAANRVLGPIYFLSYVFFVFFVLMNMFLAIINDTYAEVKSEISQDSNEFELVDYFKKGYNNFLSKLGKRDQIADLHNAMKLADSDGDNKLSFEEVRRKLKQQNFSEAEIEMWFAKYDIDGNRQLDEQETRQMLADLEGQKLQLDREIEKEQQMPSDASRPASAVGGRSGVSLDDFHVLSRRVDRMEHSIGSIVSKIDAVLVKMESMESAKTKRRDNMNKILDTISEHDGLDEKAKRQQMEQLVREELQRWDSDISMNSPRFNENNT
ncbi:polycystin-2-like [Centruroides sculpturatus]|uniref:polycystin-2-like n=2 Tax=Centruroides sculpturatus TaxID=218467 RepID=UPI000C6EF897|nr:polycystin-2-like [Centruroides sculpturatus]